jgi:AcrR family transcriptional regulator
MPRKKLKPTEEQRRKVKSMAAYGISSRDIARYCGVSEKTLLKYYREEIFRGTLEANAKVVQSLLEMATDGETPVATIYWTKARGGWNENQGEDVQPAAVPDFVAALEKMAA